MHGGHLERQGREVTPVGESVDHSSSQVDGTQTSGISQLRSTKALYKPYIDNESHVRSEKGSESRTATW